MCDSVPCYYYFACCFFFFQAEDGIRVLTVTGVQTCALPISIAKVICKDRGAVAITNPVYFRKPDEPDSPEPLRSTVQGRATHHGAGVPAEITVTFWGKEVSRTRAGADGAYRLKDVPLAAHLT